MFVRVMQSSNVGGCDGGGGSIGRDVVVWCGDGVGGSVCGGVGRCGDGVGGGEGGSVDGGALLMVWCGVV